MFLETFAVCWSACRFTECFPILSYVAFSVNFCFQDANYASATRQRVKRECEHNEYFCIKFTSTSKHSSILILSPNLFSKFLFWRQGIIRYEPINQNIQNRAYSLLKPLVNTNDSKQFHVNAGQQWNDSSMSIGPDYDTSWLHVLATGVRRQNN